VLEPHELAILNLGVQVYLPAPFYALISPCENLADLAVYQLNSVSSSECNNAVKITVKNASDQPDMCQKLAVIGVDLIKNQAITRDIFAGAQQSDDYLSFIYQAIQEKTNDFPSFIIKDAVLYKKVKDSHIKVHKFVLCLPDKLMPSAIHEIHTDLGHPSATSKVKNFQAYYYHRHAARLIKEYVRSCITCVYAGKYDIKKVIPSSDRTL
jgi:hypothetical protein